MELTDDLIKEALRAAGFPGRAEYYPAMRKGIQAAIDRLSLQAPAEPKAEDKRAHAVAGYGWGQDGTRYYWTEDMILHEDRRGDLKRPKPTAPSPVEAQTGCSCFLHFYGESGKCVKCGLPRVTQPSQPVLANREPGWLPIETIPDSDDLVWLARHDEIKGPINPNYIDPAGFIAHDGWDYWAPCEPPPLLSPQSSSAGDR